jgi:hypothetical protein
MGETENKGIDGGLDLKSVRESKGLTIKAIYNTTKVRPSFLEAIESGDFQVLPERIYSEAFIKGYAAAIGVDPGDILARYRRFLNVPEPGKVPEKKPEKKTDRKPDRKTDADADKKEDSGTQRTETAKEEGKASPPPAIKTPEPAKIPQAAAAKSALKAPGRKISRLAVSLVMSVLVVCGGFLYFLLSDDAPGPETIVKADKPAATAQPEAAPAAAPGTAPGAAADMKPAETPQQPAPGQPAPPADAAPAAAVSNKLVIHANELTWINVTEDDNEPYQAMLRPGDNLERTAGTFQLDIGNAGGIVINFNGRDMGVPGHSGQVVHLVLPPEQARE